MRIIKRGPIVECHNCKAQLLIKPKDCYITRGTFDEFKIKCPCCKEISRHNSSEVPYTFFNNITTFVDKPTWQSKVDIVFDCTGVLDW